MSTTIIVTVIMAVSLGSVLFVVHEIRNTKKEVKRGWQNTLTKLDQLSTLEKEVDLAQQRNPESS